MLRSAPVPGAAQSSKIFFRVPSSRQRQKQLYTVWCGPNLAGRSLQRAPLRASYRMPLGCARISFCGRPVCEIGISGRINSHSLSGKFITTGFHACHFFLPLSYHLFVSFSCTFRYFLLFRYTLGKRWKKAQLDAGLPTKTYCNRGAVSIDLENLFETAPAFGACFIALFLF